MTKQFLIKNKDTFYAIFRILIGLTFLLHGIGKVGALNDGKLQLMSLMGLAMVIEVLAGLFVMIGLWTRCSASIAALQMLYAYVVVHAWGNALSPLANKGEAALLFFAAFLAIAGMGSGKWAVKAD
jgi:putative oxidoreductase